MILRDKTARKIASQWHGGGGSALYALASTGAIDTGRIGHDVRAEIAECRSLDGLTARDNRHLWALDRYVQTKGTRGPVSGWATMGGIE